MKQITIFFVMIQKLEVNLKFKKITVMFVPIIKNV